MAFLVLGCAKTICGAQEDAQAVAESDQERFRKALVKYRSAVGKLAQTSGTLGAALPHLTFSTALSGAMMEQRDRAKMVMREMAPTLGRSLGGCLSLSEPAMMHLCELMKDAGELQEALPLLQTSQAFHEKHPGEYQVDLSSDLSTQSLLLGHLHRYAEAEPLVRRQIEIAEHGHPLDKGNLPLYVSSLGSLLRNLGRFEEAEQAIRRALDLALLDKSFLGGAGAGTAEMRDLALLLESTGRRPEALPYFRRCLVGMTRLGVKSGSAWNTHASGEDYYRAALARSGWDEDRIDAEIAAAKQEGSAN